jgi:tetratricopeptide (TPR) repeat protein
MADCPQCGESNPERARFCLECGMAMPGPRTGADEPVLEGDQLATTPFVGRGDELELLARIRDRSVGEPSVQLATIIGEPGVGKSRLIAEFHQLCRERRDRSVWREARCRPHEERPYAVLRRIIRSHAQIDDRDTREQVRAKLVRTISQVHEGIPRDVDRGWLLARMASLSGVGDRPEEAIDRDESFAAWRAFMEAAASLRPLVVVIEDVHWADAGTLAFVEHVTEWSMGVPMLMLCTGRPEIFQEQPGWGGGKRNATTIALSPLSREETDELLSALVFDTVLPAATREIIVDRSEGNPFYAQEFVRMLADRGLLSTGGAPTGTEIPVPSSIQTLIETRLDALPEGHRRLLEGASVVGRVFWSGAVVAALAVDERGTLEAFHDLVRRELVVPSRTSAWRETEFTFAHALVQDVAYARIPSAERAAMHRAVAAWVRRAAGDRADESAEVLAHHHTRALDLLREAGAPEEEIAAEATEARGFLLAAGDRAMELDHAKAERAYRRALDLVPGDDPDRADMLFRLGRVEHLAGRFAEAEEQVAASVRAFIASGDDVGAGGAMVEQARLLWMRGETGRSHDLLTDAVGILEQHEPGPALARAYTALAGELMVSARSRDCLEASDRALDLARRFELSDQAVRALQFRGTARCQLGDTGGLDDLRDALRRGHDLGLGRDTAFGFINLADWVWRTEGPAAGLEVYREGIEFARVRGLAWLATWMRSETCWVLFDLGEWDELLSVAASVLETDWSRGGSQIPLIARTYIARVLVVRGQVERLGEAGNYLEAARAVGDAQILVPALATAALVEHVRGNLAAAIRLVLELDEFTADRPVWRAHDVPVVARILVAAEDLDRARALVASIQPLFTRGRLSRDTGLAIVAEAEGRAADAARAYAEVADGWGAFGHVLAQAQNLLGAGRTSATLGRASEARAALEGAATMFRRLEATPLAEEAGRLLAELPQTPDVASADPVAAEPAPAEADA